MKARHDRLRLALLITAVYCHIVAKIKSTDKYLVAENAKRQMRGRKGLLKVLGTKLSLYALCIFRISVAVVVMFFLSWLPFHVQRLLTVYLNEHQAQLENLSTVTLIFNSFFYFSGRSCPWIVGLGHVETHQSN